jgi:predicted TIM-barrel fold metal-dependent hydrolase
MEAQGKRRIVDAHMHLYDSLENRYEHLEQPDGILEALIGDYSGAAKAVSIRGLCSRPEERGD